MAEEAADVPGAAQAAAANEMEEFDVIVLGTGLKECILSGLISSAGKKVLHLDRNHYYGGESASLNLEQLFEKFRGEDKPPASLGRPYDYCVDLSPKFLMACGDLVKVLVKTQVHDYLDFAAIGGSFVLFKGKLHKVPATAKEAFSSSMLGLLEKNRFRQFLEYVAKYDPNDPKTHKWGYDLTKMTAAQLYANFKLSESTQQFTGHAIALYVDDSYLDVPGSALDLALRAQLYAWSVRRYGQSPYLYPKYGLGGLPEGFSRRCAVHGGTFMLNMGKVAPFVEEIKKGEDGKVEGIVLGEAVVAAYELPRAFIKCKQLVCDPSYVSGTPKVKKLGEIARCIAILDHPVDDTNESDSCQIILPAAQTKRKSDIYICVTSSSLKICAEKKYVAVMSTNMEGKDPEAELAVAVNLLGKIDEKFTWTTDVLEPTDDGTGDQLFVAGSVDATTHFMSSTKEVLAIYERIMGVPVDLTPNKEAGEEKEE